MNRFKEISVYIIFSFLLLSPVIITLIVAFAFNTPNEVTITVKQEPDSKQLSDNLMDKEIAYHIKESQRLCKESERLVKEARIINRRVANFLYNNGNIDYQEYEFLTNNKKD